eukprot:EG_transcript_22352
MAVDVAHIDFHRARAVFSVIGGPPPLPDRVTPAPGPILSARSTADDPPVASAVPVCLPPLPPPPPKLEEAPPAAAPVARSPSPQTPVTPRTPATPHWPRQGSAISVPCDVVCRRGRDCRLKCEYLHPEGRFIDEPFSLNERIMLVPSPTQQAELVVRNVPQTVSEAALAEAFRGYGPLVAVRIPWADFRGNAFLQYPDQQAAEAALCHFYSASRMGRQG